jgi:putative spermidine/putrescine transport system permease protein
MRIVSRCYAVLFIGFMLAPLIVVVGASFEPRELLRFPPGGFSLRWYRAALADDAFVPAAGNSVAVAALATLGALLLGVPAATGLARLRFRLAAAVTGLLNAPLLVPELVVGVALLQIAGGLRLAPSIAILVAAHIMVCLPYVVRTTYAALVGTSPAIEEAAATLGAARLKVYFWIVLPMIAPAIASSVLFAFLLSFDNAVISLFLVSGRTTTLPIAIYNHVQYSLDPTIAAVSSVLMVFCVVVMALARRLGPLAQIGT